MKPNRDFDTEHVLKQLLWYMDLRVEYFPALHIKKGRCCNPAWPCEHCIHSKSVWFKLWYYWKKYLS